MAMEKWEPYFKPEIRSGGRTLADKGAVNFAHGSDTQAQAYIRTSTPAKVVFQTPSIDSSVLTVSCNCAPFKKGQYCKHIWAALISLEESNPDFVEAKTELEQRSEPASSAPQGPISESQAAYKAKRADYEAVQKEKQAAYRKEQYQRQKQRLNEKKGKTSKNASVEKHFPEEIEAALHYFQENGFELRESITVESVANARKKLARVFHPDKGGNHDEILELNRHTDVLLEYADS